MDNKPTEAYLDAPTIVGCTAASRYDRMHFGIIRIVHETLYGIFVNPYRLLTEAGLERGQQVLEVGCGPGFFTIPAAKIAGETGYVYALDINAAAVEHVRRKIAREELTNVEAKLADASETGLSDESIDVAFLFGVMHSFKDVNKVLKEMHRVLKTNGTLSIQSRLPEKELLKTVTTKGLFNLRGETKGIYVFEKREN
jgi:ubiquinone/menaquinone biosynthesis C-methylase UbiE